MNTQPAMSERDACETLRWIEKARGHVFELERDPHRTEYMAVASEIRIAILASEQSLTRWQHLRNG